MKENRVYIAIDLKSFYASVECIERNLDPMTTNLVVADLSRTQKTICLAVSPALKKYGISGRARLFEVVRQVKYANALRKERAEGKRFTGGSCNDRELEDNPSLFIDYIVAPPRMALYMEISTRIYQVYLRHIAPEDIHVYSIDEVFIDATSYLQRAEMSAHAFARMLIRDVWKTTGITATAGIGENLYLCKVAMDIVAKHIPEDEDGVRIAELDQLSYREKLWNHRPLTDFWRVGKGYREKLEQHGIFTMGDIARCSLGKQGDYYNEELLFRLFGINAELLIDHAWGWEPCTITEIKAYKPASRSVGAGQVLQNPYSFEKARMVVREMTDQLVLELVAQGLVTDQIVLEIGYDIENLTEPERRKAYRGEITTDRYGRKVPKKAHGTKNMQKHTSSAKAIVDAALTLFDEIVDPALLVRRLTITTTRIKPESEAAKDNGIEQLNLFTDYEALERKRQEEQEQLKRERRMQEAILSIKKKYGKNAVLKGTSLQEGATARQRNKQIGGHRA